MSPAYIRIQEALDAQLADPKQFVDLADAACVSILDAARALEREHPEFAAAFQALAEHLGYT